MAEAIPDLWPDIEQSKFNPPVAILREQAAGLGKKTNYLLNGRVDTITVRGGKFRHSFSVVASALDNYSYNLFWIEHGPEQYPIWASNPDPDSSSTPSLRIESEERFLEYIREVLNSDKTKRIVGSLLAQVKATA